MNKKYDWILYDLMGILLFILQRLTVCGKTLIGPKKEVQYVKGLLDPHLIT